MDPQGHRTVRVLRDTLDQLYDGQRTGRNCWDQLLKTEKMHCGSLVEMNLHREFKFQDGVKLDYRIAGTEVDCKYSPKLGAWMIPPEAHGHLCLLMWAEDAKIPTWSMGLLRVTVERLNTDGNRDATATLNEEGRKAITWLFKNAPLPSNVLLQLDPEVVEKIMTPTVVAAAQTALKREGIVILGQYGPHALITRALGVTVPGRGEWVSTRIFPAASPGSGVAEINGGLWRVARDSDPVVTAPDLPEI